MGNIPYRRLSVLYSTNIFDSTFQPDSQIMCAKFVAAINWIAGIQADISAVPNLVMCRQRILPYAHIMAAHVKQ